MEEKREYAEIDYNKLAEAIVKANYKVEEEKQQHNTLDKGLIKLTKALFIVMGIVCFLFVSCGAVAIFKIFQTINWTDIIGVIAYFITMLLFVAIFVYVILFGINLFKSAKDIENEKDRNYIIAIFSTIIGFVSLIISLVVFMKSSV